MDGLGPRFDEALVFAHTLHRAQLRKGTAIPYVSHLLAVTGLVLENGGDEDEAIAALLHDAAEDQGGDATLAAIAEKFGPRVRATVAGCSDTVESPKPPWRQRKEHHLARLREEADGSVLLVSAADKLHNARTMLADYRVLGDDLWTRFNAPRDAHLWYMEAMGSLFVERPRTRALGEELLRVRAELAALSGG